MKDYIGRDLSVGDKIVYVTHTQTSSWLEVGEIEKVTPKKVLIKGIGYRSQDKIIKVV